MSVKDPNAIPRQFKYAVAGIVVVLGAIIFPVALLYKPSPLPSPFGCYQDGDGPLVGLTPTSVAVQSAPRPHRVATVEFGKNGYLVSAWNSSRIARFADGTPVEPELDLPPDETMFVNVDRETSPTLSLILGGQRVTLPKVACPHSR